MGIGFVLMLFAVAWLFLTGWLLDKFYGQAYAPIWALIGMVPSACMFVFGAAYFVFEFFRWLIN